MDAFLDDIRLYSRTILVAEVRALYDESRPGHPSPLRAFPASRTPPPTVAYPPRDWRHR
jgi:hypothetical protein